MVDVVFTFVWYACCCSSPAAPSAFLQTTTAVFGFQAVLSPLLVIADVADAALRRRIRPGSFRALDAGWYCVIWMIAANSHVVKAALEWSMPACVALVILQYLAGQLLLFALFPTTPADSSTESMHVHILGICGTFMGGIAAIARRRVIGSPAPTATSTRR